MPKRVKDSNAPKRPLSGFMQFCQKNRSKVSSKDVYEQSKELGAMWKKLSKAKQDKWNMPARKKMDTWKSKYAAYKKTSNYQKYRVELQKQAEKMERKSRKAPTDPNMPKRPMSAYFMFNLATRKKGMTLAAVAKKWKAMGASQKKTWEDKAAAAKTKADAAMKKYKNSAGYKKHLKVVEEFKAGLPKTKKQQQKEKEQAKKRKAVAAKKKAAAKAKAQKQKQKAAAKKKASAAKKKAAKQKAAAKKKVAAAKKKAAAAKKKAAAAKKKAAKAKKASKKKSKAKKVSKKKTKRAVRK